MYITISPQKLGNQFSKSVSDFVEYLEKENREEKNQHPEFFFNQSSDKIIPEDVIREIDGNTLKLKNTEPRYYSITVNPSQRELRHIHNDPSRLKDYVRDLMKDYAASFNREISGRAVQVSDIKYYAKIEYHRTFKGTDREIKQNAPFYKEIVRLENQLRQVQRGEKNGSVLDLQREINKLYNQAPHKSNGKMIEQGMEKPGLQTHVHLIVSRKDKSNSVSLSPGSKYKSSEVMFNGKLVRRGFDRDNFFQKAEQRFDEKFSFNRNFVESYSSRKTLLSSPKQYYLNLLKLPSPERKVAMELLKGTGISLPKIPHNKVQFALKQLKQALEIGIKSSSIGY